MGRELKRVPLDFKWALGQLWKGYVNPYNSQKCKCCDGSGNNEKYKELEDKWYGYNNYSYSDDEVYVKSSNGKLYRKYAWMYNLQEADVLVLAKHGRLDKLMDKRYIYDENTKIWSYIDVETKNWIEMNGEPEIPKVDVVNEYFRNNTFGHDSYNSWLCINNKAKIEGINLECEYCEGKGHFWYSEEIRNLSENFKRYDPPVGNGYQLWTTTSEGSPMTPVFESLDALCQYCEDAKISVFGNNTATKEEWKQMLNAEFFSYTVGNITFI